MDEIGGTVSKGYKNKWDGPGARRQLWKNQYRWRRDNPRGSEMRFVYSERIIEADEFDIRRAVSPKWNGP
ncbi:hypothetical protein J15TS10_40570 [Paenibacillus woosongensis]|uniref:Transposase n=1 Tax=Paenibacillus woosongensis TaxID=307580 RepID=A0ABQ4MWF8_9BACL|nr:hypothetical protein J15TS10_40570 [Paenibacillus woosongensis]